MRLTLGTLAVTAAAVFVGLALWPDAPGQPVAPKAVAQSADSQPETVGLPNLNVQDLLGGVQQDRTIRGRSGGGFGGARGAGEGYGGYAARAPSPEEMALSKLKKPLENVSFTQTPLSEVIEHISQSAEVDILIDRKLTEDGADLDEPLTLEIRHAKLPAATVLELALDQAGLGDVAGYTIRDGFVYITSKSQSNQIHVYNVRDLVFGGRAFGAEGSYGGATMPGGGYPAGDAGYGEMSGMMPGMMGGEMGGGRPSPTAGYPGGSVGSTSLTEVIRSTIRPQSWADAGGEAGLAEYNGLLIVKAGQDVHREIEQLLQMMRSAMRGGSAGGEAATTIIPVPRR